MDMQQFDFREDFEEILSEVESLSNRQRKRLYEAIKVIKEETVQEIREQSLEWFHVAVAPILKSYAEETESLLTFKKQTEGIMVATLENQHGFEISNECKGMKVILSFVSHISLGYSGDSFILTLIFDCSSMIK